MTTLGPNTLDICRGYSEGARREGVSVDEMVVGG